MNEFHLKRPAAAMLANVPLRGVLIAAFTALAIGAVGIVGTLAYYAGQQAVTTLARQLLAEVGERINQRLTSYFSGPEYVVQTNAALIRQGQLDWRDTATLARHFAGQLRLFTGVTSVGLVTENREFLILERYSPDTLMFRQFGAVTGYLLNRYRADRDGQPGELIESRQNFDPHNDPPGKPWYPVAREAGQGGWRMSVSLGRGQDQPVLVSFYHLPLYDASGALQGVLVSGMTLTSIGEFLQGLKVSAGGQAFLLDRQGLLVATSTGETPFDSRARTDHLQNVAVQSRRLAAVDSANPLTAQAVQQLLAHEPALERMAAPRRFDFAFNGQRYFAEVAPLVQDMSHPAWLTVVVAPEKDFIALMITHLQPLILLAGLGLVIAILLGLLAAGGISRPLAQLNMATRRLAEGDFSQPIPPAPIRELRDVGESFSKMTQRLRDAFAELRAAQQELANDNQRLEVRVEERTAELIAEQQRVVAAMAQVAQSEAKFRGMFEQSPLGVALLDSQTGRLLEVNERLTQILGQTREELATIGWIPVTHPDDLPAEQDSVARLQAGETAGFQMDKRYLRPDGSVVWGHLTVAAVTVEAQGSPLHLALVEDITARKTAEAQWQASERKMRKMLDNIPLALSACTLEPEPPVIFLNEQFTHTFGYTLADIPKVSDWFVRAYPDEDYRTDCLAWWQAAVARAAPQEGPIEAREFHVTCRNGAVRDVMISAIALEDMLLTSFLDITARKQAEAALRDSEEKFRLAFRNANIGMCLVDLQGHLLQVNDKMSAIFGYSPRELESMTVNDLALPEDAALSPEFIQQAMEGTQDSTMFEKHYRHRQGHIIYGLVTSSLVRDTQGQPQYFISQVQDITQRKQLEEKLRLSEEQHRLLADNSSDVISIIDLYGRVTYVSPSVEKLRGYTPAEVMQQSLEESLTPEGAAMAREGLAETLAAIQAGLPLPTFRGDFEQTRKDGSTVWTDVTATCMQNAAGEYIGTLVVSRDITERKRYERELQQARDVAEAASQAKSEFLANMSHEIRTPMNAVLGLAQLLEKEPLAPDQLDMVQRIRAAGRTLLGILNDILDFSKIEAGRLQIEAQPFALAPLLVHLENLQGSLARDKGLAFHIEAPAGITGGLVGDALRLEQILLNLIGNAIKFTEQGAIRVQVQPVTLTETTVRLRFEVRDTGVGIAPEVLPTLFEPFTQADGSITRRFGGAGLGLSICKRLVDLMGGTIDADSTVGMGSVFWFELPFARTTAVAPAPEPGVLETAPAGPRLAGRRILVVDDSDINRTLVARALRREGAETTLAHDGQQALDALRAAPQGFDAVLMDVQMPVLDGLSATRAIRRELGLTELPIIALTASVLDEDRRQALAAGVNDFLGKPVDLEEMATRLQRWTGAGPRPGRGTPS